MQLSNITYRMRSMKIAVFALLAMLSPFVAANTATDAAKKELSSAAKNIQACVTALNKVGDNPLLDKFLATLNPNTTKGRADKEKTFKKLQQLAGKPLGINANQVEMCLQVLESQLQLVAANKDVVRTAAKDSDIYSCPSGTSSCPGGGLNACCTSDEVCAYQCAEGGGPCTPYCEHKICFPSEASVRLEDGSSKFMYQLEIGDRVQVVTAQGAIAYEDIYMMTHNDASSVSQYLQVSLASGQLMTLSPRHFIPTAQDTDSAWQEHVVVGANELKQGDIVWYQETNGKMYASTVTALKPVTAKGAFNPLTASGTIVVDGVVASAHSDWFLDGVFSADTQAAVYQAMFMPVRGIYNVIGAENMTMITQEWGVVDFIREATETPAKMGVFVVSALLSVFVLFVLGAGVVSAIRKRTQRVQRSDVLSTQ